MSKAVAILLCCAALCAQTTLKQLGYPEGTKLLIIHADDLGVAHSVDRASFRALDIHNRPQVRSLSPLCVRAPRM